MNKQKNPLWITLLLLFLSIPFLIANYDIPPEVQELEQKAIDFFINGNFDYALYYFYEAAQASEGEEYEWIYYQNMALCHSQRGDYDESINILSSILEYYPYVDIRPYNNIAESLKKKALSTNDIEPIEQAIEWLQQAIQYKNHISNYEDWKHYLYKDIGELYAQKAEFQFQQNQSEEAQNSFAIATRYLRGAIRFGEIATEPDADNCIARSYYYLGLINYRLFQGQQSRNEREAESQNISSTQRRLLSEAVEYFNQALEYRSDFPEAQEALELVDPSNWEEQRQQLEESTQEAINDFSEIQNEIEQEAPQDELTQDDIVDLAIKTVIINQINRDRAQHGLPPVEIDPLASKVGDDHCREQQNYNYLGHQSINGANPYYRYSQEGGDDYNQQNTAGRWGYPYNTIDRNRIISWCLESHQRMVNEVPPNDGHRQNILDPHHTHVGIGLAYSAKDCFLTQEFLNRYCSFSPLPRKARVSETLSLTGRPVSGYSISTAAICYEDPLSPLTPEQINNIWHYSLPSKRDYLYIKLGQGMRYNNGSQGDIEVNADKSFEIPIKFEYGPGVYTIVVYMVDDSNPTEGVIPASTISIEVSR